MKLNLHCLVCEKSHVQCVALNPVPSTLSQVLKTCSLFSNMCFELNWQLVGLAIQELAIIVICEKSSEVVTCGITNSRNLAPQSVKTKWPQRESTSAWYIKFSLNQCLCYLLQSCLNWYFLWDLFMCCWLEKIDDFFFDALMSLYYLWSCWKPGTYGTQFSELNWSLINAKLKKPIPQEVFGFELEGFNDSLGSSLSLLELQSVFAYLKFWCWTVALCWSGVFNFVSGCYI